MKLSPKSDVAHFVLGMCSLDTGDTANAAAELQKFLDLYWDRAYIREYRQQAEEVLIECANIFWKIVRRLGPSKQEAESDMFDLTQLAFSSIPTRDLAGDAIQIALDYSISAYDACYVALAQRLSIPLLTADEKLIQAMPAITRWLGDLDLEGRSG